MTTNVLIINGQPLSFFVPSFPPHNLGENIHNNNKYYNNHNQVGFSNALYHQHHLVPPPPQDDLQPPQIQLQSSNEPTIPSEEIPNNNNNNNNNKSNIHNNKNFIVRQKVWKYVLSRCHQNARNLLKKIIPESLVAKFSNDENFLLLREIGGFATNHSSSVVASVVAKLNDEQRARNNSFKTEINAILAERDRCKSEFKQLKSEWRQFHRRNQPARDDNKNVPPPQNQQQNQQHQKQKQQQNDEEKTLRRKIRHEKRKLRRQEQKKRLLPQKIRREERLAEKRQQNLNLEKHVLSYEIIKLLDKILGVDGSNNNTNNNNDDDNTDSEDEEDEEEEQQQLPPSSAAPKIKQFKLDRAVFWTHPGFLITYFLLWKELVKRKKIADKKKAEGELQNNEAAVRSVAQKLFRDQSK